MLARNSKFCLTILAFTIWLIGTIASGNQAWPADSWSAVVAKNGTNTNANLQRSGTKTNVVSKKLTKSGNSYISSQDLNKADTVDDRLQRPSLDRHGQLDVVDVERLFIQLQRRMLDSRSEDLNRWQSLESNFLVFMTLVIAALTLGVGFLGIVGFRWTRDLRKEAERNVERVQEYVIQAAEQYNRIQEYRERSEPEKSDPEYVSGDPKTQSEAVAPMGGPVQQEEMKLATHPDTTARTVSADRPSPDEFIVYRDRGTTKARLGRYEEAIIDFDKAIQLKVDDAVAYRNRGIAKGFLGRHEEAIPDFDEAIRLQADDAVAYRNRGITKGRLGLHEEAITDFDEAIRRRPDDAVAYRNRGVGKRRSGRHKDAIADFDVAIRLKPDYSAAFQNRGTAKGSLGRHEEAIADFDEAIRLKSDDAVAYRNRGITNGRLGRHEEAIADFDEAIRLKPDDGVAYRNRGVAKGRLGRHDEALEDFNQAIRVDPN